ncbi:MAG: permease [bacterium]|nr:permease [bacterium]
MDHILNTWEEFLTIPFWSEPIPAYIIGMLGSGFYALFEYLSGHVITCLVPAFFIAGAISIFISQEAVLRYLGPKANRFVAYGVASVSGAILAVCSCTVLPLFGGIYKRGAGIGPATAFLYAGPAINVLAIVYTARLLGMDIGAARAVGAVVFALVIGVIMAQVFARWEAKRLDDNDVDVFDTEVERESKPEIGKKVLLFVALLGVLVFGAAKMWLPAGLSLVFTVLVLVFLYSREEVKEWLGATWYFVKLIVPWLLGGVFAAGIIKYVLPESWVVAGVGENTVVANLLSSVFGALMYFATLTEVPIIKAFAEMGMHKGPALTLLLAGPALSLPNMLVIRSIMGTARTVVFVLLVVVFSSGVGLLFGLI